MALTHVDVLQVHHTRLCAYTLQNMSLLAQIFQVCVIMEQQAVKSNMPKIAPTGFVFTDGLMTIIKLVQCYAGSNDSTNTHNTQLHTVIITEKTSL
jgi:hypothetical protein